MQLKKKESGLLLLEEFKEQSLLWHLSPSEIDCLSFSDNGLQIKHNEKYITYCIPEPDRENYCAIVEIDHIQNKEKKRISVTKKVIVEVPNKPEEETNQNNQETNSSVVENVEENDNNIVTEEAEQETEIIGYSYNEDEFDESLILPVQSNETTLPPTNYPEPPSATPEWHEKYFFLSSGKILDGTWVLGRQVYGFYPPIINPEQPPQHPEEPPQQPEQPPQPPGGEEPTPPPVNPPQPPPIVQNPNFHYEVKELFETDIVEEDIGGVIVFCGTKDYVECQSFYSELSSEPNSSTIDGTQVGVPSKNIVYKYMKVQKYNGKHSFFASHDGVKWITVGSCEFGGSGLIGFFLRGTNNEKVLNNSHFIVKSFRLYSGKNIAFHNIKKEYELEIFDKYGKILLRTDNDSYKRMFSKENKTVLFDTSSLQVPIEEPVIRIFKKDNYDHDIARLTEVQLIGGDSYVLMNDLKIYYKNEEINQLEMFDLGNISESIIKLTLSNKGETKETNIKLKVIMYSEYFAGQKEMLCSLNMSDYMKELKIDELNASESIDFYLKLDDNFIDNKFWKANDYRFKILIE